MSRVRSADDDPPTRFPVASTVFLPSPRRIRRGLNALLSAPRLAVELRRTADDKQKGKTKMRNLDEETDEFTYGESFDLCVPSTSPWHHPLVPRQPDASLLLFRPSAAPPPRPPAPPPPRPGVSI